MMSILQAALCQFQAPKPIQRVARVAVIERGVDLQRLFVNFSGSRQIASQVEYIGNIGERNGRIRLISSLLEMKPGLTVELLSASKFALVRKIDRHIVEYRSGFLVFTEVLQNFERPLVG